MFQNHYTTPTLSTGKFQSRKISSKATVCQMSINFLFAQHTLRCLHILETGCTAAIFNCSAVVRILRKTVCVIKTNNYTYCHILIQHYFNTTKKKPFSMQMKVNKRHSLVFYNGWWVCLLKLKMCAEMHTDLHVNCLLYFFSFM